MFGPPSSYSSGATWLYEADRFWFGVPTSKGVLTPNEWWQQHLHPALFDLGRVLYGSIGPAYVGLAAYFRFSLSRHGTAACHGQSIAARSGQMLWAPALLSALVLLLAPWVVSPWGMAKFGWELGPPSLSAVPAVSLPVAWATLFFYYSLRFGAFRALGAAAVLSVAGVAVVLGAHYVGGVLLGVLCGGVTAFTLDMEENHRMKRAGIVIPDETTV